MQLSRRWLFALFFLSGFSGLVCQIIWLRLAFAAFGIVTPVMSVLLSGFMLGLGAGSWLAGAIVQRWNWPRNTALRAYAATEFAIGMGALIVPLLFQRGEELLLPVGNTDSFHYLAYSAAILLLSLLPFCLCMGFTFPFMLQAIKADSGDESGFSFLYLANVVGAMCGTLAAPFVLVELLGFRATLGIAAAANWCAAAVSFGLSLRPAPALAQRNGEAPPTGHGALASPRRTEGGARLMLIVLFTTGLASLAAEVVWTRAFTPVFTTQVYWFAGLLFTYLLATWVGSWLYRRHLARGMSLSSPVLLAALALAAFGQLLMADPRIQWSRTSLRVGWILLSLLPYCGILGYLTPKLIDEYSAGNPTAAGRAYAVNVVGCILGPLLASYLLLPWCGAQWSGMLLALPLWGLSGWALRAGQEGKSAARLPQAIWLAATACGILVATVGRSRETWFAAEDALVLWDHTATVVADEPKERKRLFVNGTSITLLTPTTKLMAHLPLAHLDQPPRAALVICFGMGTTFRSLTTWGIETTAVELSPSVRNAFPFFFPDAREVAAVKPGIQVDDGRRYLRRTTDSFDLITLDPPPPVEAAGSSLLYSKEFYDLVKARLSEQGILQQWYPGGDRRIFQAALRSVVASFPHVRVMHAYDGVGLHILASLQPIPHRSAAELAARLPDKARADLTEWTGDRTAESLLQAVVGNEVPVDDLLDPDLSVIITDDHPYNEYCLLRRLRELKAGTHETIQ